VLRLPWPREKQQQNLQITRLSAILTAPYANARNTSQTKEPRKASALPDKMRFGQNRSGLVGQPGHEKAFARTSNLYRGTVSGRLSGMANKQ
jgi:hypothetical protein